jgi:hypothetical protein
VTATYKSRNPKRMAAYSKFYSVGLRLSVDATVTIRRLQALRRIGYSASAISDGAGVGDDSYIRKLTGGGNRLVYRDTALKVEQFYNIHHMRPAPETAASKRAITAAIKAGFPGPLCWNNIGDLKEKPKGVE